MRVPLIVFLRLERFYVACERRHNPHYSREPLAVIRDHLVMDSSLEAEEFGVKPGIKERLARRRCVQLQTVPYRAEHYLALYHQSWQSAARLTPLVEPVNLHEGFLDLSGCLGRLSLETLMQELKAKLRFECGLEFHWAAGGDRWISRLACGEDRRIDPDHETSFLARASVRKLEILTEHADRLARYGIFTVGDLQRAPLAFLQSHLQLARAEIDSWTQRGDTLVRALYPPRTLAFESRLSWGSAEELQWEIVKLAHLAEEELRRSHLTAGRCTVKLRTQTGEIPLLDFALGAPSSERLLESISECFARHGAISVRGIRLELSDLTPRRKIQLTIWDRVSLQDRQSRLGLVRHKLERKYGSTVLRSGGQYADTHPPRFAQLIYQCKGLYLP